MGGSNVASGGLREVVTHYVLLLVSAVTIVLFAALGLLAGVLAIPAAASAWLCRGLHRYVDGIAQHVYVAHLGWFHQIRESAARHPFVLELPGFTVERGGVSARIFKLGYNRGRITAHLIVEHLGSGIPPKAACLVNTMGPSMPILPVIEYISHEVFDLPKTELIPVTTVLTTSDHWSFMGGNADVAAAFTGVAIYGGEDACVAGATDTCRDGDIITVGTHLHFEVIGAPDGNKRHLLYYLRGVETGRASPTEASAALFSGQLLVEMTALNLVSVIDRCDLTAYVHSGLGQNAELPTDVLDPSDVGKYFAAASFYAASLHRGCTDPLLLTVERLIMMLPKFHCVVVHAVRLAKALFLSLSASTHESLGRKRLPSFPEDDCNHNDRPPKERNPLSRSAPIPCAHQACIIAHLPPVIEVEIPPSRHRGVSSALDDAAATLATSLNPVACSSAESEREEWIQERARRQELSSPKTEGDHIPPHLKLNSCASCSPPCSTFDPFVTLYADDVEALEHRMAREEVSAEAAAVELRKLRSEWRERTMLPIHSASFASLDMDSVKAAFIALGTPASPSFLNSNGRVFVSYSRLWRVLNKLHLNITFCPEEALRLFWRDSVSDSLGNSPDKAPVRDLLSKIKLPECEVDLEINVGVDPHISKETCPLCTHLR